MALKRVDLPTLGSPTIPSFILSHSPLKNPLFARAYVILLWNNIDFYAETPFFKLLHSLIRGFVCHMDITIHGGLPARSTNRALNNPSLLWEMPVSHSLPLRFFMYVLLSELRKRAYHNMLIIAQCAPFLKAKSANFSDNRRNIQITGC